MLPTSSTTLASTVNAPSASAAGTSALNEPSACTTAVTVCTLPALSVIVSVTTLPGVASVVPDNSGVVSFVSPISSRSITGGVISITPAPLSDAVFPNGPTTVASTVNGPSESGCVTSALNEPSSNTVAVTVCTLPSASVMVSVTVLPGIADVSPVSRGVVSLDAGISSSVNSISADWSPSPDRPLFDVSLVLLALPSSPKEDGVVCSLILSTRTNVLPPSTPPPPLRPAAVASNDSRMSPSPDNKSKISSPSLVAC